VVTYDVDRLGLPPLEYHPLPDALPDPGEVVWTWIPYEDDPTRGKDRPAVVLARLPEGLLVSQMTSQDHDRDATDEARFGRYWFDVGAGPWDRRGRPSEARLDRMLVVQAAAVRRVGGALAENRYHELVDALTAHHAH